MDYFLPLGTALAGRYHIEQVVGFGGFGIIYKVRDSRLETAAAVKEYFPSGLISRSQGCAEAVIGAGQRAEYARGLSRFLDEARHMAKFNQHKHIVNVFDYFEENHTAYIVMEYLEGVTLNEHMKANPADADLGVAVTLGLCAALTDIHRVGILHRDISPSNIFLCADNTIKLIDFGAARFSRDEEKRLTIVLKPGYAPPEQYEAVNTQGAWTDVYALGATLYRMVTGVQPMESISRKIDDTLADPAAIDPRIPDYLSHAIMKAMAVDWHFRFATAKDFALALTRQKKSLPMQKERQRRVWRRTATLSAAVLVILATAWRLADRLRTAWDASTLPAVSITLWYPADDAKGAALTQIVDAFLAGYDQNRVTIMLTAIETDGYADALTRAFADDTPPHLFESTGLRGDGLEACVDLSPLAAQIAEENGIPFLASLDADAPLRRLPLGFDLPVLYVNSALAPDARFPMADLYFWPTDAAQGLVIDERYGRIYQNMYGAASLETALAQGRVQWAGARNTFLAGGAAAYFAGTEDLAAVQNALPAWYRVVPLHTATAREAAVVGAFAPLWSISAGTKDEIETARRLLRYFTSNFAQELLHIQGGSGHLPLERGSLEGYLTHHDLADDFAGFFDDESGYAFLPIQEE